MDNKANILVVGTSGAGKSTLINTVLGREEAHVGMGKAGTEKMRCYESEDLNFRLIDSRGFEFNLWNTKKAVKDMKTWMKEGLKGEKPRIHMLWFCVDATSKRFTKQTVKTLEEVKKEWHSVPIIVVLTKSFFIAEDDDNIAMVRDTFERVGKKTGMPLAIIPVLSVPPKGEDIESRGIDELIEFTVANLDTAVAASEEAVKKYELKRKRVSAQVTTIASATTATVVGAVPIPIPDGVILAPLETALVMKIAKTYNLDKKDNYVNSVVTRIIEAGTVGIVAKAAINKLKLIPGVANLAADVLNAIVAGSIVLSIGEASAIIMEKVYLGDIDRSNFEWLDKIVDASMGKTITKVNKLI
ncbi:MAG: 50S ribosome-binding GTPase, partial [Lachnospiraceae bacterium]|nr:50S ribosome-binding GTPase [Lachnospiraceae bacterium]